MPAYTAAGISRYVQGLLGGLASLCPDRVAALLSRREKGSWSRPLAQAGLPLHFAFTPCHHRLERWSLAVEALPARPALFHAVDHVGLGFRPFPMVVTVHDLAFWRYPWTHRPESRRHYAAAARTLPHADAVICVSSFIRDELLAALPLDPARVHVVHNGLDARFRPASAPNGVCVRYGLSGPYVLAVGTIEARKNITLLLEALRLLNRPDLYLALAGGEGWGSENVRRAVDQLGLTDNVRWLGRVPDDDLVDLYSAAAVLAFPSRYEGFAFPPLEAMACGTPVVALRSGPLPEVCGVGELSAATLTDPTAEAFAAGLALALDDSVYQAAQIERGRKRAAQFTWERCARETLSVYRSVGLP